MFGRSRYLAWSFVLPAGLIGLAAAYFLVVPAVPAFQSPGCGSEEGCYFGLVAVLTFLLFALLPLIVGAVGVFLARAAWSRREPLRRFAVLGGIVNGLLLIGGIAGIVMFAR